MKITINGLPGEGKTTVAAIIEKALRAEGLNVIVDESEIEQIKEVDLLRTIPSLRMRQTEITIRSKSGKGHRS